MHKEIDGLLFYVKDSQVTADFYNKLGFETGPMGEGMMWAKLNAFFLHLVNQDTAKDPAFVKEAGAATKGSGLYVYVKVDDVDAYFQEIKDKGIKPSSEPKDWPWGNREFALRDPDGYKLVFYTSSKS